MPACGNCTEACNCTFSEDGIFSGNLELGRNFTMLAGSGTEEDPYTISFLDQEEFRPRTAEIAVNTFNLPDATGGNGDFDNILTVAGSSNATTVYESPVVFVIRDTTNFTYRYLHNNLFIIGASITFAETSESTSIMKHLIIAAARNALPTPILEVVAGHSTPGSGGDPVTLTCAGFVAGTFVDNPALESVIQEFFVYAYQDTGAPVSISNARIWITQI